LWRASLVLPVVLPARPGRRAICSETSRAGDRWRWSMLLRDSCQYPAPGRSDGRDGTAVASSKSLLGPIRYDTEPGAARCPPSVDRWRREALEVMDPRVSLLGLGAMPHFIWSDHDRRSAQDFDPSFDSDMDHGQCSVYEHAGQHQLAPATNGSDDRLRNHRRWLSAPGRPSAMRIRERSSLLCRSWAQSRQCARARCRQSRCWLSGSRLDCERRLMGRSRVRWCRRPLVPRCHVVRQTRRILVAAWQLRAPRRAWPWDGGTGNAQLSVRTLARRWPLRRRAADGLPGQGRPCRHRVSALGVPRGRG